MKFIPDPVISEKIDRMKSRVCWQDSTVIEKEISQTKLVIDAEDTDNPDFSFTVIGDSGCGSHLNHHPQRKIAEMMVQQELSRFVIHTGDVVYQVGSSEYYQQNFIDPYQEYLEGGENPQQLEYDSLTFKSPFFLVPGNHDYYNLPLIWRRGNGKDIKRPYSFLRIDVRAGDKPQFTVNPFVAEWHQGQWNEYEIDSFVI